MCNFEKYGHQLEMLFSARHCNFPDLFLITKKFHLSIKQIMMACGSHFSYYNTEKLYYLTLELRFGGKYFISNIAPPVENIP